MTTKTKPDYTFGELGGVGDLAALGIEIEDDAPAAAPKRDAAVNQAVLTFWILFGIPEEVGIQRLLGI